MNLFHAFVLGAVQGFTEVLPISSSAHLILVPWFLGWAESGLTFDVALHLGTFIALTIYFRRDIAEMSVSAIDAITHRSLDTPSRRLPFLIIASAIPAAIIGALFESHIEEMFRSKLLLIAVLLVLFGGLLGFADMAGRKSKLLNEIGLASVMLIGMAQCLALLPGVSRSGITITAALILGFSRESSARFSFLMSLPIVAGAAFIKILELFRYGISAGEGASLFVGIVTSALTGYISVAFLLRFVQKRTIAPFVWYRVVAGVMAIIAILTGINA